GVGAQHDIQVEVAVTPAVRPLAALAGEPQPLAVGRPLGYAGSEGVRHAAHASLLVELGHREAELDLGAEVGILQGDMRGDLVVLTGHAELAGALPPALPAASETREEVGEIDVVE